MKTIGIVAFAFGIPSTIRSNRQISEVVLQKARELGACVYTQPYVHVEPGCEVTYTEEVPGCAFSTLQVAQGAVKWALRKGFGELLIVAATPHLWRAARDVEWTTRETGARIKICVCKETEQYPNDSWFCPDSLQDRTRSREVWERREGVLKRIPFWAYKYLTK